MKLTKSKLKQIIKEELLNEQMNLQSVYYSIGDAIENLDWFIKRHELHRGDKKFAMFVKQFLKVHKDLTKHLDKNYPDWN